MKAVEDYPNQVKSNGGDPTVCEEFIALYEIRKCEGYEEMIRAAYERAIQAATAAVREADTNGPGAQEVTATHQENTSDTSDPPEKVRRETPFWLLPTLILLILAAASVWLQNEEDTDPILLASIVVSMAYLLGFSLKHQIDRSSERTAPD